MPKIDNKVVGTAFLKRTQLKNFQWDLKNDSPEENLALQKSIKAWFIAPIFVWHEHDNLILDWHQRLKALNALAADWYMLPEDNIPVVFIKAKTKEEAMEQVLKHNSSYAPFNMKELMSRSDWLNLDGINIKWVTFDAIDSDEEKESMEDDFPDIVDARVVQEWDIFEIDGTHRIWCLDATKLTDVLKLMDKYKADLIRTDPPYNVNYKGNGKNTKKWIKNDNMSDSAFQEFLNDVMANYMEITKEGTPFYIFHSPSTQDQFMSSINHVWAEIKSQLIWNKPSINHVWADYKAKHEPFFYCCKKWQKLNFYGDISQKTVIDREKSDEQILKMIKHIKSLEKVGMTTVRSMKRHNVQDYTHPTQKPVELAQMAIQNSSKQGDIVVDLFLWSGTALVACMKTKRVCYWTELDPKYIEAILKRIRKYTDWKVQIKCINRDIDIFTITNG